MALTYKQAQDVKATIPALREYGEKITTLFYRNMLLEHPELHNYFNTVNQRNGRQPRALTSVILTFASNISHVYELIPKLEKMCNKHCSLGIQPDQYQVVCKHLMGAFAEVLQQRWTPELETAWLKAYWLLAKMLIGREQQIYKSFGEWKDWRDFRIIRKVAETPDIVSFYLAPVDGQPLPSYLPGQFVSVQVHVPSIGYLQSRQYSLSDRPRPDYYRITVKRELGRPFSNAHGTTFSNPGLMSNYLLDEMKAGDVFELTHPTGEFFLDTNNPSSVPIVLISVGVGCSAAMSILATIVEACPTRQISWIQGIRNFCCFQDELKQITTKCPNVKTRLFKSCLADGDVHGVTYHHDSRVDLTKIDPRDLFLENRSTEFYVSGSNQFLIQTKAYLMSHGIEERRIQMELLATGELEMSKVPKTPPLSP